MKKVLSIVAIATLVACGGASTTATTDSTATTVDTATAVTVDTATTVELTKEGAGNPVSNEVIK